MYLGYLEYGRCIGIANHGYIAVIEIVVGGVKLKFRRSVIVNGNSHSPLKRCAEDEKGIGSLHPVGLIVSKRLKGNCL